MVATTNRGSNSGAGTQANKIGADSASLSTQYKVKLRQLSSPQFETLRDQTQGNAGQKRGTLPRGQVVFDVTPDLVETRTVDYRSLAPLHLPGQIYVYGNTQSRQFTLSAVKLISRTIPEATRNMQILWTLRGWTMPYFGQGTLNGGTGPGPGPGQSTAPFGESNAPPAASISDGSGGAIGKPPEILLLSAYANLPDGGGFENRQFATNIHNIPVVISSLTLPYPSDVDYIPDENGQPMPRVMMLDIQLLETRAPRELSQRFSLQDYRQGILGGF